MATYQITASDGATYRIDGPDDADPSAIIKQLQGVHRPQSLDLLPGGQTAPTGSPAAVAARSPVSQSDTQNFLAGAGKATYDLGRGAGQWLGLESRQDVADSRKLDAPLMSTKAGKTGDIVGTAADLYPLARIPGAGTLGGAAAIGAGTGALMPSASTGETLGNTALGAVTAPAGVLIGRGLGALYQGGRSALEPFFQGGQERIAARTLQSFAGDQNAINEAVQNILRRPQTLPGVEPTTAELSNNAGIAQLERTLRNNPEAMAALTARNQANRAAMTGALQQMGGTDAELAGAQQARTAAAAPLYDAARDTVVPADADLGRILTRPVVRSAWARAAELAANRDEQLVEPSANDISGRTLQYLKMALQDTANTGPQRGIGSHELGAVRTTLGDLQNWITDNVPELRAADQAYAQGSAPINQMQITRQLSDRLQPALADFGNNSRLNAASYANALRNGDQLAANVTGNARATLGGTLTADQGATLRQIGEQLARRANADELGRAVGSNTGQNLASQNLLRQMIGPLGLPQGLAERAAQSTLGQSIARPYQWAAAAGEPNILRTLNRAALDPGYAADLLRRAPNSAAAQIIWNHQGLLGPAAHIGARGLMGSGNASQ